MTEKSNDSGKGTGRKNGLKCLNKLKKAYPNYIFGLANGRPHYRETENSRNRKMSKTMEKLCDIKRSKSKNKSTRRKSRSRSKSKRKSGSKSKSKRKSKTKSKRNKMKSKSISKEKKCKKSSIKKYISRPGPPYPAQDCKNKTKSGNDGNKYRSSPNKNGIFRWKKL